MTQAQIRKARKLVGKMDRREIAAEVGVSLSNLKRAFRGTRLAYYNYCVANPDLVRRVNKFYETHIKDETAKHFGLSPKQVDHIVYRYKLHRPKQTRWTAKEIQEAVKMAGLVSAPAQARFFRRPNAHAGSVKSLWTKRFGHGSSNINGMVHNFAKHLVTQDARYLRPKGISRDGRRVEFRRIILWVDMEKVLKPDVPPFVRDAVKTMADFQRWIHGGGNIKVKILKLMKERESSAYVR